MSLFRETKNIEMLLAWCVYKKNQGIKFDYSTKLAIIGLAITMVNKDCGIPFRDVQNMLKLVSHTPYTSLLLKRSADTTR